jgi:hypothetical protein
MRSHDLPLRALPFESGLRTTRGQGLEAGSQEIRLIFFKEFFTLRMVRC